MKMKLNSPVDLMPGSKAVATCMFICALALTACATGPKTYEPLDQAKAAMQEARTNARVSGSAPVVLSEAEKYLTQADTALKAGKLDATSHHTAMAQTKIETAYAIAKEKQAAQELAELERRRESVSSSVREQDTLRTKQELEQARREAAQAAERAQQLTALLAHYKGRQTTRGIVIILDNIKFNTTGGTLLPDSAQDLEPLITYLNQNPRTNVAIEGHTDSTGSTKQNEILSDRRAYTVKTHLIGRNIDPNRLSARGLGEAYPIANNSTRDGRLQNRRIEILISEM